MKTDPFIEETVDFLMSGNKNERRKKLGIRGIIALIEKAYHKGQIDILKKQLEVRKKV